ncbi:MAG: hypothetical protein WDA75_04420 [Candidatus Latescibacterota bacterium]|jgi:hypothetical protein
MDPGLRAGTAKVEITPLLTVPYLGYVPRQARFEGVHDPLHARALVIEGEGNKVVALVAVDAIGLSSRILGPGRHLRDEICRAVEAEAGIPPQGVMLAASHAHSTPETLDLTPLYQVEGAVAWLEELIRQLAQVTAEARSRIRPVRLKYGVGHAEGIAINRRQLRRDGTFWDPAVGPSPVPLLRPGLLDEEVGVLVAEWGDRTFSALLNFTCHAVSVQVQPLVSADYPGVACRIIENLIPECRHCLFTQGADGDVNPIRGGDKQDFGDVARYGQILGGEALKVIARLRAPEAPAMPSIVDAAIEEVHLPGRELPDPEPLVRAAAEARAAAARAIDDRERYTRLNQLRAAEESLRTIELARQPMRVPVQVLRLGDLALVGCPGEMFVQLGLEIKQQTAAPHALVVGYANDYAGYLSTPTAFLEGGYETSLGPWTQVGPTGGRMVVDAALALVHRLWVRPSA